MATVQECDILQAIRKIERLVNDGWSVSYARKLACGKSRYLNEAVSSHPSYVPILNAYMRTMPQKVQYENKGGSLQVKKLSTFKKS